MDELLLRVENLHVHFRLYQHLVKALNGVNLDLYAGEILGVVGETGSGKSMTALSVLRLVPNPGRIISGRIGFQGQDLLGKSEREMREVRGRLISMVFQNPRESLNPVFTIGEQLTTTYRTHTKSSKPEATERALDMLRSVGMADPGVQMDAYPHQLSGGM